MPQICVHWRNWDKKLAGAEVAWRKAIFTKHVWSGTRVLTVIKAITWESRIWLSLFVIHRTLWTFRFGLSTLDRSLETPKNIIFVHKQLTSIVCALYLKHRVQLFISLVKSLTQQYYYLGLIISKQSGKLFIFYLKNKKSFSNKLSLWNLPEPLHSYLSQKICLIISFWHPCLWKIEHLCIYCLFAV